MMQEQPADSNKKDNEVVEEGEMDVLEKVNHLEKYFLSRLPISDVNSISNQDKLNFAFFCLTSEELTSIPDSKIVVQTSTLVLPSTKSFIISSISFPVILP